MNDEPGEKVTDPKPEKPIPATPGFHAKPGEEPKFSRPDEFRATPGYQEVRSASEPGKSDHQAGPAPDVKNGGAPLGPTGIPSTPAAGVPPVSPGSASHLPAEGPSDRTVRPPIGPEPFNRTEAPDPFDEQPLRAEPHSGDRGNQYIPFTPRPRKSSFFPPVLQEKLSHYTRRGKQTLDKSLSGVQDAKNKLDSARGKAREEAPKAPDVSVGTLVSRLSDQIQKLVTGEIELAKTKGRAMIKKAGLGLVLLAVAGILALYMLGQLIGAAVSALALVLPLWAAQLIVAAVLLVIVGILALAGQSVLKKGLKDTPAPQEGVKESIDAVKKGLEQ